MYRITGGACAGKTTAAADLEFMIADLLAESRGTKTLVDTTRDELLSAVEKHFRLG